MDDEEWVTCPYDRSHRVPSLRIQRHLVKCEQRYPPLAICPYNATHRMPEEQMWHHLRVCKTRDILEPRNAGRRRLELNVPVLQRAGIAPLDAWVALQLADAADDAQSRVDSGIGSDVNSALDDIQWEEAAPLRAGPAPLRAGPAPLRAGPVPQLARAAPERAEATPSCRPRPTIGLYYDAKSAPDDDDDEWDD